MIWHTPAGRTNLPTPTQYLPSGPVLSWSIYASSAGFGLSHSARPKAGLAQSSTSSRPAPPARLAGAQQEESAMAEALRRARGARRQGVPQPPPRVGRKPP
jgi:hypothetical protein